MIYLLLLLLAFNISKATNIGLLPTRVSSFIAGTGQNSGQDKLPNNVLRYPSNNASQFIPETSPDYVVSLGFGGEITLEFDKYIIDGDGIDFIVFENAFEVQGSSFIFQEPGIVSVSKDGVNFYTFPHDSLTLQGMAGLSPTNWNEGNGDKSTSGGDGFDLALLNLDSIKYIRIIDFAVELSRNPSHPKYSPILSGFDLDAVVAFNYSQASSSTEIKFKKVGQIIEFDINELNCNSIIICDLSGKIIMPLSNSNEFDYNEIVRKGILVKVFGDGKLFSRQFYIE